jgi:hypothetical protein
MNVQIEPCPACKAPVTWAINIANAAWTPLDAEPSAAGMMAIEPGWDGRPRCRKASAKLAFGSRSLRQLHTVTCTRRELLKTHHHAG